MSIWRKSGNFGKFIKIDFQSKISYIYHLVFWKLWSSKCPKGQIWKQQQPTAQTKKNSPLTHTTSFKTDNISYFKSTYHTFHISTWVSFLILVFVLIMAENNDDKLEVIGEETMTSIRDQHYNVVPKSEHKIEAQVRLRMYWIKNLKLLKFSLLDWKSLKS